MIDGNFLATREAMRQERTLGGAEDMRAAIGVFNSCRESFNDLFTALELLQLWSVLKRSEWTILPDEWSIEQLAAALKFGEPPRFDPRTEAPVMPVTRHKSMENEIRERMRLRDGGR